MSPVLRVSEAARTGDVPELKRVLDAETITKRDFLLKTRTDGATPLIIAARNGNTAIVQCLLDEYDVDLEQEGTVKIDGDLIECCTPLWMGSLGGHLAIVRLLLERGAEVNHTTLTNSTPLRAASFNGHTEVFLISRLRVHIQLKKHFNKLSPLQDGHWSEEVLALLTAFLMVVLRPDHFLNTSFTMCQKKNLTDLFVLFMVLGILAYSLKINIS